MGEFKSLNWLHEKEENILRPTWEFVACFLSFRREARMERRRITVGGISSTWEKLLLKTYKCDNGNGNGPGQWQ